MKKPPSDQILTLTPIGFISSGMKSKFDAPFQPEHSAEQFNTIELVPKMEMEKAVEDLNGFEYIWLIWWFHRNRTWRPKIQPPRGSSQKRGVLATRSPHRPNPLGISAVRLISIAKREIVIGPCDLVSGTPILDIKPYIPSADSFPGANIGWLADVEESYAAPPSFTVEMATEVARTQLTWLSQNGMTFFDRAIQILERDPTENKTRRIKRLPDGRYRLGCAEWRVYYRLCNFCVQIVSFGPGYSRKLLDAPGAKVIANHKAQLRFLELWPDSI